MMTPSAPMMPLFTSSLTSHTSCTHNNTLMPSRHDSRPSRTFTCRVPAPHTPTTIKPSLPDSSPTIKEAHNTSTQCDRVKGSRRILACSSTTGHQGLKIALKGEDTPVRHKSGQRHLCAQLVYLCSGDILQFEELLHQDLVDLHQNHIHPISVDQRQVSVTLSAQTQ